MQRGRLCHSVLCRLNYSENKERLRKKWTRVFRQCLCAMCARKLVRKGMDETGKQEKRFSPVDETVGKTD